MDFGSVGGRSKFFGRFQSTGLRNRLPYRNVKRGNSARAFADPRLRFGLVNLKLGEFPRFTFLYGNLFRNPVD